MEAVSNDDMLATAREYFKENKYSLAEPILNQLILKNAKSPDVFHMLGTIYYDQGKFNKAIRAFRRALELEPTFTDASVGLSIILNDIGKYEEGRKVFDEAREMLARQTSNDDPYINEKFSIKHDELGEMYFHHGRFKEALEQYFKALALSSRRPELTMKVVECFMRLQEPERALKELRSLVKDFPGFLSARIRLGKILYDSGDVAGAIEQWEATVQREPAHGEANRLLRQAQALTQQRPLAEM
ncbi:MAG: tetratricopeptide repeat protein [Bdellovibrionales bacterium]